MKFSYSRVSSFANCPYKWWLHYIQKYRTIPDTNADNALWLGLGLHKGIETGGKISRKRGIENRISQDEDNH